RTCAERPVYAIAAAGIANRGDTMAEPEFVDVLGRRALLRAARMPVQIHETGQRVHAVRIDLTGRFLRTTPVLDRQPRCADAADLGDPVVLDHDVGRTPRRRARAIDDGDATYDEPLVRSVALGTIRCLWNGALPGGGRSERERREDGRDAETEHDQDSSGGRRG